MNMYDLIGWICSMLILSYVMTPFMLLEFWKCIQFFSSFYWVGHIATVIMIILLPKSNAEKIKNSKRN